MTATKTCEQCGKTYPRHRSFGRDQWASSRFCSRQCRGKSITGISTGPKPDIRTGIDIPCKHCGKMFYAAPWEMNRRPGTNKFCSKVCTYAGRELKATFVKGHADMVPATSRGHNEETKRKIAEAQRLNPRRGSLNPNWRGGSYRTERQSAMATWQYREWRMAVFRRDDFTCQSCGERGGTLNADHIRPWSKFPDLRYELNNGRTLCVNCHRETPTWGVRSVQEVYYGQ